MAKSEDVEVTVVGSSVGQQLVKVVLGATAGFIASKLVERGVDAIVAHRHTAQ